jgi:hypothetical protein
MRIFRFRISCSEGSRPLSDDGNSRNVLQLAKMTAKVAYTRHLRGQQNAEMLAMGCAQHDLGQDGGYRKVVDYSYQRS